MYWTGDNCVLVAWDAGWGPAWETDPYGKPLKAKMLGPCQVWRAFDPENTGNAAVCIGETEAQGFLDTDVQNGALATYWCMEEVKGGGLRQVGPTMDVEVGPLEYADDTTPPSDVDDLEVKRTSEGNLLTWSPACDAESGLLAYFVYDSNQDQPDAILWASEESGEGNDDRLVEWLDRTTNKDKAYFVKAIDKALNLNDGHGPVTGEATAGSIGDDFVCGLGCTIGAGVTIGDRVTIGDGVAVGELTAIGDDTTMVAGTTIGERCTIGADVHITAASYTVPDDTVIPDHEVVS